MTVFVAICYFLKSIKSVFILVHCNTSLSKNYIAHSITLVCMIGWIWEKRFTCALALCHMKSLSGGTSIFPRIRIQYKALKTFVKFRICWIRSKLEHCRIQIRTSSHLCLSYVTGVVAVQFCKSSMAQAKDFWCNAGRVGVTLCHTSRQSFGAVRWHGSAIRRGCE